MIPNVFVSSTIIDLHHLRDSVRDTISEIGYVPVISEYGDIGYLPSDSAENSCYLAMKDCQLAIFIISKRYGYLSKNGISVTHNEFRTARKQSIPVIFLVDEEIMAFKRVADANTTKKKLLFPGMENPIKVFDLIREFVESENNNGLITYTNVQSAKFNIKKQLAHIVGDLLRKSFDPVQGEIKDILTEITTLKHFLVKNEREIARTFAIAFRELLDEKNESLRNIIEEISGSLEDGVPEIIKYKKFQDYLVANNVEVKILDTRKVNDLVGINSSKGLELGITRAHYTSTDYADYDRSGKFGESPVPTFINEDDPNDKRLIYAYGKRIFIGNSVSMKYLEYRFGKLLNKFKSVNNNIMQIF